jgi:hypothetical protein
MYPIYFSKHDHILYLSNTHLSRISFRKDWSPCLCVLWSDQSVLRKCPDPDCPKNTIQTPAIERRRFQVYVWSERYDLCIAVQTKDLDFKPSIFRKLNVELELDKVKNNIEAYKKLLNVL